MCKCWSFSAHRMFSTFFSSSKHQTESRAIRLSDTFVNNTKTYWIGHVDSIVYELCVCVPVCMCVFEYLFTRPSCLYWRQSDRPAPEIKKNNIYTVHIHTTTTVVWSSNVLNNAIDSKIPNNLKIWHWIYRFVFSIALIDIYAQIV